MKNRTVVISSERLNRKGFRVLTEGADLSQYKKNPILLWMHMRPWRGTEDEIMPIGKVNNVRKEDGKVMGELEFDTEDPFAKKVADKWDKGIYKMVSPGLTPIEFSEDSKHLMPGQKYATLTKWRLDEVSVSDIGANDDAMAIKNRETGKYVTLTDDTDLSFLPEIKTKEKQTMKNIALKLGLAEDANEKTILEAIGALNTKIETLQTSESEIRLKAITNAVETAIREKRITEKQKEHYVSLGDKVGLDMLNETLGGIEPAVKPTELIDKGAGSKGGGAVTKKEKWEDYTEAELEQLKSDDVETYKLLFNQHYGFEPNLK